MLIGTCWTKRRITDGRKRGIGYKSEEPEGIVEEGEVLLRRNLFHMSEYTRSTHVVVSLLPW